LQASAGGFSLVGHSKWFLIRRNKLLYTSSRKILGLTPAERESSLHVTNTTYSGLQEHRIIVFKNPVYVCSRSLTWCTVHFTPSRGQSNRTDFRLLHRSERKRNQRSQHAVMLATLTRSSMESTGLPSSLASVNLKNELMLRSHQQSCGCMVLKSPDASNSIIGVKLAQESK
jgi:hypothetical protein